MRAAYKKHGGAPDDLRNAVLSFYNKCVEEVTETIGETVAAYSVVAEGEVTAEAVTSRYIELHRDRFVEAARSEGWSDCEFAASSRVVLAYLLDEI